MGFRVEVSGILGVLENWEYAIDNAAVPLKPNTECLNPWLQKTQTPGTKLVIR